MPFVISLSLAIGIWFGSNVGTKETNNPAYKKIATILGLIEQDYVDTIDMNELIEMTLPDLMASLDPHSSYIKKSDFIAVNSELEGSFSGVGISFQILNDTITIVEVITGGPAEKVGLKAGDRIVTVDGESMVGEDITNEDVFKTLRGTKGSKVVLGIKRNNSPKIQTYDVIRGEVPVKSVDAYYMLDDTVGFIKVSKFSRTTYSEFLTALLDLRTEGAIKYIIDLRDNSGGYLDQAILMINEFLTEGKMIVYTLGRCANSYTEAFSDGTGSFISSDIAVLTNEYSASASEIFAGAIQDNDRGIVVGRRTFGKGLVQNQIMLPDSSAIRLTVSRYYTASGRSIQKDYVRGKTGKYEHEIVDRYSHGEFYNSDSIKLDKSKIYHTIGGREVYGGGGIMPDVFVAEDTTSITSYYINVANAGLIQKFAFDVADNYRDILSEAYTAEQLLNLIPRDATLLNNFVNFAASKGIPARWYYIRQSQNLLLREIKAMIVRDVLGYNEFFRIYYENDKAIKKAHELLVNDKVDEIINLSN